MISNGVRRAVLLVLLAACSERRERVEPAPPTPPSPKDAAVIDASAFLALFGQPGQGPSSADAIAKLEQQAVAASPEEKAIIQQLIAAMRELDAATTDRAHAREHQVNGVRQMHVALRAMMEYAKGDPSTQRTLISSFAMTGYQIEAMEIADAFDVPAIRRESLDRGRALVKVAPRDAHAWKLLGWLESAFAAEDASSLAAIRAYQTCARLDASIPECSELAGTLREAWVQPYCDAGDIKPGIGWWEQDAAAPRFTSKDAVRLQAHVFRMTGGNVYDSTGKVIDKAPDREEAVVNLELAPAAIEPMVAWETEVRARAHYFELRVGDRMIATTKGSDLVPEPRPTWTLRDVTLDELCRSPKRRPLPPDVAGP